MNRFLSSWRHTVSASLVAFAMTACERPHGGNDPGQPGLEELFSTLISEVGLELDYAAGE